MWFNTFVVELYTEWFVTVFNSLQDIDECLNRVIYFLADCCIRVTALLEYLDLHLQYYTNFMSDSSTLLKSLSKLINPSVHQFSNHSPEQFLWHAVFAGIMLNAFGYLFPKLCWHNRHRPRTEL